jgi:transposase
MAVTVAQPKNQHKRPGSWTPARGAWLLVKPQQNISDKEKRALERMLSADGIVATVYQFVQQFTSMIRQREATRLTPWIQEALRSGVPALARFARHLLNDFAAVQNALLLPWSNGQVEGQIHRLKLVKRQMYGRANFDLLRRRVIGLPCAA